LPRTVLLADDSVTAQNMGRRILTDAGYEVITVNNGSAALKKIHENKPDLIVLDVYMPGYGGLEVCQRLKESGDTMRIPVLLTVGKMEPFKTEEARRVRADGHIIKPFEASELLAALTKLEDRIVPRADPSRPSRHKKEEKSRFWRIELEGELQEENDRTAEITRLAEAKKREKAQADSDSVSGTQPIDSLKEPGAAVEVPAPESEQGEPATLASATEQHEQQASAPVSEFPVTEAKFEDPVDSDAPVVALPEQPRIEEPSAVPTPDAVSATRSRWVVESVALSAEEAALSLHQEMQQARSNSEVQSVESTLTPQIEAPIDSAAEITGSSESGAAFAAAACASGNSVEAVAAPSQVEPEEEAPAQSEASAAWTNWEQIRDSVMAPQQAEAIVESVAEIAQSAVAPQPESSRGTALSGEALAGIVDSVLAELKPKLMEEIAKKLAADKK